MSLSARRAWIEIIVQLVMINASLVALRKESVDRNLRLLVILVLIHIVALRKESVDRNDIRHTASPRPSVALRKESVDRNHVAVQFDTLSACRSPQGERG